MPSPWLTRGRVNSRNTLQPDYSIPNQTNLTPHRHPSWLVWFVMAGAILLKWVTFTYVLSQASYLILYSLQARRYAYVHVDVDVSMDSAEQVGTGVRYSRA